MKSKKQRQEEVAGKLAAMAYCSMVEKFDPQEVDERLQAIHEIASRIKVTGTSSKPARIRARSRRSLPSAMPRRTPAHRRRA